MKANFHVATAVHAIAIPNDDSSYVPSCYVSSQSSFIWSTQMGREALEGFRFLASLPLAGTGQREGGGFSCINKRIISHPVTLILQAEREGVKES